MRNIEHYSQAAVMKWAMYARSRQPGLELLYANANAGRRTPRQGRWMKDEGLRAGVPDLFLPVPRYDEFGRCVYHGFYIEMKSPRGKLTADQARWIQRLEGQGYYCRVCRDSLEAIDLLRWYMSGQHKPQITESI